MKRIKRLSNLFGGNQQEEGAYDEEPPAATTADTHATHATQDVASDSWAPEGEAGRSYHVVVEGGPFSSQVREREAGPSSQAVAHGAGFTSQTRQTLQLPPQQTPGEAGPSSSQAAAEPSISASLAPPQPPPQQQSQADAEVQALRRALMDDPSFWQAHADRGTDYDISAEELRFLTDPKARKPFGVKREFNVRNGLQTTVEAFRELDEIQDKPSTHEQQKAFMRLKRAFELTPRDCNPDLWIKIVNDLDIILFGGTLHRKVYVSWEELPKWRGKRMDGICVEAPSTFFSLGSGDKAHVMLNKEMFFTYSKTPYRIWGALIHQLIHAHTGLNTYRYWRPDQETARFGHDEDFRRCATKCVEILGFEDLEGKHVDVRVQGYQVWEGVEEGIYERRFADEAVPMWFRRGWARSGWK
jgi:hypothetical protein